MLRTTVATLACLAAVALAAAAIANPFLWPHAAMAALFAAVVLFERRHYKQLQDTVPAPPWERTAERFVDPETGRLVEVWTHPPTGTRRYVAP